MTADELRTWMRDHGYTVAGIAQALSRHPSTVQRWRDGSTTVPDWLPLALERLERPTA